MPQGTFESKDTTILCTLKEIHASAEDYRTFFNYHCLSPTRSLDDCKERIKINFERFKGNYLALLGIFTLIFLIKQVLIIPLLVLWAAYAHFALREKFVVNNIEIRQEYLLACTALLSIAYLVYFNGIISSMLILFSVYVIMMGAHMVFYSVEQNEEEEEV